MTDPTFLPATARRQVVITSRQSTVTFPAAEHHRPFTSTKLHCLVTEAHFEQLAQLYAAKLGFAVEPAIIASPMPHKLFHLATHAETCSYQLCSDNPSRISYNHSSKYYVQMCKKLQLLGDLVPQTPYRGFAPGPTGRLPSPEPLDRPMFILGLSGGISPSENSEIPPNFDETEEPDG